jgi:hypothetical protein
MLMLMGQNVDYLHEDQDLEFLARCKSIHRHRVTVRSL